MTNLLATVSASILTVISTNWNVVGNLQLTVESRSFMVQEGTIYTNTYVVFPYRGTNHWQLVSAEAGPKLEEHQLIERVEMLPSHRVPMPLPQNPPVQVTNVGKVIIQSSK